MPLASRSLYIHNSLSKKRNDIVPLGVSQYLRQKDWIFKRSVNFFHIASEAYVLEFKGPELCVDSYSFILSICIFLYSLSHTCSSA